MSQDPLKDIQDAIGKALTAHPYFSGIPVITERKGDVMNKIAIALGKLGICVVVQVLTGRTESMGAGAYSLDLKVGLTVTENVPINQGNTGSKKPASEMVAMILCLLNPNRGPVPAYCTDFVLVNDSGGLLIYLINGKAAAGFQLT